MRVKLRFLLQVRGAATGAGEQTAGGEPADVAAHGGGGGAEPVDQLRHAGRIMFGEQLQQTFTALVIYHSCLLLFGAYYRRCHSFLGDRSGVRLY